MSADHDGTAHTAEQVATRLGVSLGKVYGLLKTGELGHYKVGDTYRIPTADLAAYIARVYVPAKHEGAPCDADTTASPRINLQERVA